MKFRTLPVQCVGFFVIITLVLVSARAEESPKTPPMLWKIEGNTLMKPSWLYGTIPMPGLPESELHKGAERAFTEAEHLYTEGPLDTESQKRAQTLIERSDGKTLEESLGNKLAERLNGEMQRIIPRWNISYLQKLQTWVVPLYIQRFRSQPILGETLSMKLWHRAVAAGKMTAGLLEENEWFKPTRPLTEEQQIMMLRQELDISEKERAAGINLITQMTSAYNTGKLEEFQRVSDEAEKFSQMDEYRELDQVTEAYSEKYYGLLAAEMLDVLKKDPKASNFFVVGIEGLTCRVPILLQLEAAGYRVTKITE